MKDSESPNLQKSTGTTAPRDTGFSPWQRLKTKRISYLTIPLLVMATVTEFVILATGWKYQQVVCLPQGMGVTFFGIGPIGATILAVELLKLPLAIWTASRHGWQKGIMLVIGLPLICVLTFQLVKDMAVYEMGVALAPATQMLEKASTEETKIAQLNGELAAIEQKKADHEHKLAELDAKQAKSKSDIDDSLKRNDDVRHDAVSLTDYQKKELSEVDNRESAIIAQFNSDTAQLTKALAELRARREALGENAARWNAEEARIENAYKIKLSDYQNKKAAYDKEKAAYDNAGFLKRQLLKEPIDPGVPPVRESNIILKPIEIAQIDTEVAAKEVELQTVNNKRRERVAQVEAEAHQLRDQYDQRSVTKREQADKKRDELLAAEAALGTEWKAERLQLDQELAASVQKVDGIRVELDAAKKTAEGYYEAREAAIRKTQVHRIATTVEIVRGLIKGERPMSIKMTAKERGDILTDQISMVRIWVYPVLAFIVAFLPTLMVEIGFSTVFEPDQQRPEHRFGFMGRHLHWVEARAGRQKIFRAERTAKEALAEVAGRDRTIASTKLAADRALAEKSVELQAVNEAFAAATEQHKEELAQKDAQYAAQSRAREEEWVAKLATMADSLNRTVVEKDTLRDLQKSEVERLVQARQKMWSDRLAQARQELDEQRASSDAERAAMMEEHQKQLSAITGESKDEVSQLRRRLADADATTAERISRLTQELKEASRARDTAEMQLKQQSDSLSLKLAQTQENASREIEKAARQEKHRLEWQELEFQKKLRLREDALEQQLKQREQELTVSFETRLEEEKAKTEEALRHREADRGRHLDTRAQEMEAYWNAEIRQREEAAQARLKQREQQLQAQADARVREAQAQAEEKLRAGEAGFKRQIEEQASAAEARLREELQQREASFNGKLKQREEELGSKGDTYWAQELQRREEFAQAKLRQREQQLQTQADIRVREAQTQAEEILRDSEAELKRQLDAQSRAAEARLRDELQQKETTIYAKLKQREQDLTAQADARVREAQALVDEQGRARQSEFERLLEAQSRAADARLRDELQQKETTIYAKLKQREQELTTRADARMAELEKHWADELQAREEDWERRAELRVSSAEARLGEELQQKEEIYQTKLRQREQQWQAKLDAMQHQSQVQTDEAVRRRSAEADAAVREIEGRLLEEMQQKEAAFQTRSKQREQEVIEQVRALWESEADAKMFAAMESFKGLLSRTEKERDEARQSATESARRVEGLEKKLTEASSFLNAWRNGGNMAETT